MIYFRKYLLLLATFVMLAINAWAQPENATIENIEGKKHYVHFVQGGNTLYGIHKLYNTPIEVIIKSNPGVEKGLTEGQRILIPVEGSIGLEKTLALHKVKAKETVYGIARDYNCTPEELTELNPEISKGLVVGQEIKVPIETPEGKGARLNEEIKNFKVSFKDTLISHQVKKGETLFSLSKRFMITEGELKKANALRNDKIRPGDVLKIPIKKERVEKIEVRSVEKSITKLKVDSTLLFKRKDFYQVAILMPLNLDGTDGQSSTITDLATEFYMGTKLALDVLEAEGLNARIFILDAKGDSLSMLQLLKGKEMQEVDIVIGPFFGDMASLVAEWCQKRKIRMICPFSTNYEIIEGNPYVYQAVSSDVTLSEGLATYLLNNNANEKIVLVKSKAAEDMPLYNAFRKSFVRNTKAKNVKLIESDIDNFQTFISDKTTIVFLSNNKSSTRSFFNVMNKLGTKMENENLKVFTTKDAANLDDLPTKVKGSLNLHFIGPHDFYYEKTEIKQLHKIYRKAYNSDMSKMSVQGYDLMYYIGTVMLMQKKEHGLLMNQFNFKEKGDGNGFENQNGYVFKFQDYQILTLGNLYE